MSRIARLVVPGLPHHVTQRGNGRQKVFYREEDYALYVSLLAESCRKADVICIAWCLMPNHIHAILVPGDEDGLRAALAPVNRRYAGLMNARRRRTGHFWQGRYGCAVMDEEHLAAAFRYILRNPVTARLARQPQDWRWSSARAYLEGKRDGLTDTAMMRSRYPAMKSLLLEGSPSVEGIVVRDDESIGRPRGSPRFIKKLERRTGRSLAPGKRGPKPQEN